MIENLFAESCMILTPDGYISVLDLLEQDQFKAWTNEQQWREAYIERAEVDYQTLVTTAKLSNGFTNVTGGSVNYLTTHDQQIDASGILGRPLSAIYNVSNAYNKYVWAGLTASLFYYQNTTGNYYVIPMHHKQYRDDLFCLYWSNPCFREGEQLTLMSPKYKQGVLDIYGSYVSAKAPTLPLNIDQFTDYQKSSLLRGILSAYFSEKSKYDLQFNMPNESMMSKVSDLLTELGIENITQVKRVYPVYEVLRDKGFDIEYRILVPAGEVSKFMNQIGLLGCENIDWLKRFERSWSVTATEVQNVPYDNSIPLYSIKPYNSTDKISYFAIIGGVYVKIQVGNIN